ncbi:hypothetical protein [Microbacterium karelineae]|uniref:hypothetical protein n=1 Tax=Microbacterium karelineae TaxID=2654283 RepID=UPI0018D30875|nr:hypothetical protein [Microbacterium karelineae]
MTWIREVVRPISLGGWAFELLDDDIAGITYRGGEVLRSVRAVVRDRDWATAEWVVDGVEVLTSRSDTEGSGESVSIPERSQALSEACVSLSSTSFGADLRATLTIRAHGPVLTVALEATTARAFLTNRTGLVVLHPPALAGAPLEVRHSDGSAERTAFPADIAPHQPAVDIAGLSWGGVRVEFAGDTFEMEDQRNWTDASFKTYSRPLSLPFPYEIAAGETVRQSVTVTVATEAGTAAPDARRDDLLSLSEPAPAPTISVGASTAPDVPRHEGLASRPDGPTPPLLVELDLGWGGWPAALERAAASGPLDARLVLPEKGARAAVAAAVAALAPHRVVRIAAFRPAGHEAQHVSDAEAVAILREALAESGLEIPVIGGTRAHFTELNRELHRIPAVDCLAFSTTPLFHTRETRQLEEAVAMQRLVAEQAVRIADGSPVHIGPVTLRPHVNNVATTAPPRPCGSDLSEGYGPELLDADDPRQAAPELAAWTIASAAALAVPGVASISFFEEWGPRGIHTADGADLPVAEAVRALAALAGPVSTAHSTDGQVWAIAADSELLVANLDGRDRTVEIDGSRGPARVALPARSWRRIATTHIPTNGETR